MPALPTRLCTHAAPLEAVAQLRGDICEPAELTNVMVFTGWLHRRELT